MVFHHPEKFGDHKHCDNGYMFLICHMILQDHVTKEPCDFIGRYSSR